MDTAFLSLAPKVNVLQQPQERLCSFIYTCRPMCLLKAIPINWEAEIKCVHLSEVLGFSSSLRSQPQIKLGNVE